MGLFSKKDVFFKEGTKHHENQDFESAVECYKQVAPESKNYNVAMFRIVALSNELQEYEQGEEYFSKIPQSDVNYQLALGDYISILLHQDKYKEAMAHYRKVKVESNEFAAVALINNMIAIACAKEDDVIDAKELQDEAKYAVQTVVLMKLEKHHHFVELLKRLLVFLSKYEQFDSLETATTFVYGICEKYKKQNPYFEGLTYFKAEILYEAGKFQEALDHLNTEYSEDDESCPCHDDDFAVDVAYLRALIYQNLGNEEAAKEWFDEVYSIENSGVSFIMTSADGEKTTGGNHGSAPRKRKD